MAGPSGSWRYRADKLPPLKIVRASPPPGFSERRGGRLVLWNRPSGTTRSQKRPGGLPRSPGLQPNDVAAHRLATPATYAWKSDSSLRRRNSTQQHSTMSILPADGLPERFAKAAQSTHCPCPLRSVRCSAPICPIGARVLAVTFRGDHACLAGSRRVA